MNDRYDITKLLTKDHAGGVYEGEDTVLSRKVACRRFFDTDGDTCAATWQEEFTNFTHKLTALHHPNLALVYDAGIDEDGAFLITQLIKGDKLADILQKRPLEEYEIFSLANDVLEAFTMIHAAGETHGALLPSSVVRIDKTGGRYRHRITDLGIASLIPIIQGHAFDAKNPALTPPEQLKGETSTPSSDLFMLGQLCYTMAVQGHPFSDATHEEAIALHESESQKNLSSLAPQLSESMSNWIHSLIRANPTNRPQSAEQAQKSLPVIPRPNTPLQPASSPQIAAGAATPTVSPTVALPTPTVGLATPPVGQPTGGAQQPALTAAPTNNIQQPSISTPPTSSVAAAGSPSLTLASQKSSKKGLFLLIGSVVAVAALFLIISNSKKKDEVTKHTATENKSGASNGKKKEEEPVKVFNTSASISPPQQIKKLGTADNTPVIISLKSADLDDYAVFSSKNISSATTGLSPIFLMGATKYGGNKFATRQTQGIPLLFSTERGDTKPVSVADTKGGLSKGEGWDIELFTPAKYSGTLALQLYLVQVNAGLKVEIVETTHSGDKKSLSSETLSYKEDSLVKTDILIKEFKPDHYYHVRVTRRSRPDKSRSAIIGISAITVKNNK